MGLVHGGFFLLLLLSHFFCSHVGPSTGHGPFKGVPAPAWAPPQATVPSEVSLPQCGHLHRLQSSQRCPCSDVESLLPRLHLQPRPQQCPLPHASPRVFFSALSHTSPCASRCTLCHQQLLPFLNKPEQRHSAHLMSWSFGRHWVWSIMEPAGTGHDQHRAVGGLFPCSPLLPKPVVYPQHTGVPAG